MHSPIFTRPSNALISKEPPAPTTKLKIFLIQTAMGLYSASGGYKANCCFLAALSSQGHACRSIVLCWKKDVLDAKVEYSEEKRSFGDKNNLISIYRFTWNNIEIVGLELEEYLKIFPKSTLNHPLNYIEERMMHWLEDKECLPEYDAYHHFITGELMSFDATHFVFNDSISLKIASTLPGSIVRIFICHACEHLPFGPYSGVPGFGSSTSPIERKRLKEIEGVWAVSYAIKSYIDTYGEGVLATFLPLHPTIYGKPPYKRYYNFDATYVLITNPSSIKGYTIFKKLAEKMPDVQFAAIKSWGVSEYQLKEMESTENITIFEVLKDMEELWPKIKVLIVPSLWYEAFGLVAVEATLRGIPVICSDAGGLPEAKCGIIFGTIHVNITDGEREIDESMIEKMGIYKIPPQNIDPWIQTLRYLISNRDAYEKISQECCERAMAYIENINTNIYENWLIELRQSKSPIFEKR
ncbi:UDP-Glycosyltransferase/glycogen phosphorylase [Gigaspora margarita]|uniref:UDP-Glycosyltransferase/glycogen phosphorylase n=1 Tax=Gigaspora margarita TaxID=4874 RepID=A0A8H4B209_GIGMA|nr:UDP-Glycosyltransferase/glycogen phosphorylase [Gigaspora margarita]